MFEEYQICPYTGLRSFTEEESLYFKGRDQDIEQATLQLQRNKFLMLTGASGDGKSSLVYAGIVPNARAGFLKSTYTQWRVAEFRPERNPFGNLCKALTRQLDIPNPAITESELHHGFSALIDLYKNSDAYLDSGSIEWQQADDKEKAALKRRAGNLMIIVDQFEEFFTNPENYHQGVPSKDSNLVLNLLLETARIALDENLPVYVVFTMRSDFIGQCAAFRSLPEFIGFSQYFVPRLNRLQLQQVIEEPAELSGNRISRRLTERLIHDIAEGVDQLPILQHALNQIWHAANKGKEEMDLIHYAMVGGMPASDLPDDQTGMFKSWFDQLPEHIRACYHRPSLQNVLDTHANKLYESAEEYYTAKTGKPLPDETSKAIIRTAFSCLTKIDQSRAVRNRMTLNEIWQILNRKEVELETVGQVLNIFREPGNTFIRPFMTEDPETANLGGENVLDITHESLIRNWDSLKTWAKAEYDSYQVSQDFEQQLGRWVQSGKSNNFLLSIGPLTYFENWFKQVKPNSWWIARYLPEEEDAGKKKTKAEALIANANEFLARSAQKHVVTRTVMKLGPRKIAAALGLLVILTLSSFALSNYLSKRNSAVLKTIKKESLSLANNPKLGLEFYVPNLTQLMQEGSLTLPEIMESIKDPWQKIHVSTGIAKLLQMQGKNEPAAEMTRAFSISDSLLTLFDTTADDQVPLNSLLNEQYNLKIALGFALLHSTDSTWAGLARKNAVRSGLWAKRILADPPGDFNEMRLLMLGLEDALHYRVLIPEDIHALIGQLSPFSPNQASERLSRLFDRDQLQVRGTQDYGYMFNALFQDLAYLYAAAGDEEKALWCIDSLLSYPQGYLENNYETMADNATNIAAHFFTYGHLDALERFIRGYSLKKGIPSHEFYNRMISRSLLDHTSTNTYNYYNVVGQAYTNMNLKFSGDDFMYFAFRKYREAIQQIADPDQRSLNLAVAFKNEAILLSFRNALRGSPFPQVRLDSLFDLSLNHYRQVRAEYLSQVNPVVSSSEVDRINVPNSEQYLFPDYFVPFHPFEPRGYLFQFNDPAFVDYILRQDLFKELYRTDQDIRPVQRWLNFYNAVSISRDYFLKEAIPADLMTGLAEKLEAGGFEQRNDLNLLYLHLGNTLSAQNKKEEAWRYYQKIQPQWVLNAFQYKGMNFLNTYSLEQYGIAIGHLFSSQHDQKALDLIGAFKKPVNRSSLYAFAAQQIILQDGQAEIYRRLIDSARSEMNRIDNPAAFQPNRHNLAIALMLDDPERNATDAYQIIKNSPGKLDALGRFGTALSRKGLLYKAWSEIPTDFSDEDRSWFLYKILYGYNHRIPTKPEWKCFEDNMVFVDRYFLPYINEND
ncbi:MAG TPA: hypothetical protein PKM27_00065 [Saprospiraceae bacterium]|nr:hypothetical protein [Saprospiraceae bacterium]HNT19109.1 hypothetical protein [Saprospiraceae bacterium]